MATNGVRQCTVRRTEVVINTIRNYISAERDTKYHYPKITISNETLSHFNFMKSFQTKMHWDCFLPQRHKINWNGYCPKETDYLHLQNTC
jgi:hypothetical protein